VVVEVEVVVVVMVVWRDSASYHIEYGNIISPSSERSRATVLYNITQKTNVSKTI
jgi:hypothetical protein